MARRKIPRIHEITFEDGPLEGLNVKVKSIKFGKVRQLIALMDDDSKDTEVMDQISKTLADAIVWWDLQEEDGSPVEPSLEAIDDLEFDEVMAVVNKWLDQITGPGSDLGKGSPSGVTFPGQPLTMEAL